MNDVSVFVLDAVFTCTSKFIVKKLSSMKSERKSSFVEFTVKSRRDSSKKTSKFIEKENT
jgi:hypothetical protein